MSQSKVYQRSLGIVAGVLVLASLGAGFAQAAPGCAFEVPVTDASSRDVTYEISSRSFQFTSRPMDVGDAVLGGTFDLEAARVVLESRKEGAAETSRLVLEYAAAVEFRDLDGDARLGFGDDIVREYSLPDSMGATLQSIPRMDAGSHEALARYPLNGSSLLPGVLEIRFVILSQAETIGEELRSADRMFVEVAVDGFPFLRNDTRLALRVRQHTNVALSAGAEEIVADGAAGRLSYRWSRCVEKEDGTAPVGPVVLEYPSGAMPRAATVFAFPYGERIEHATSMGLAPAPVVVDGFDVAKLLPGGNALTFGLAALGAAGAIGMTAWRRIRGA